MRRKNTCISNEVAPHGRNQRRKALKELERVELEHRLAEAARIPARVGHVWWTAPASREKAWGARRIGRAFRVPRDRVWLPSGLHRWKSHRRALHIGTAFAASAL